MSSAASSLPANDAAIVSTVKRGCSDLRNCSTTTRTQASTPATLATQAPTEAVTGLTFDTDIAVSADCVYRQGFRWDPLPGAHAYRLQWSFPNLLGPTWTDVLVEAGTPQSRAPHLAKIVAPDTVHFSTTASARGLPQGRYCVARIAAVVLCVPEGADPAMTPAQVKLGPWTRPSQQFATLTAAQLAPPPPAAGAPAPAVIVRHRVQACVVVLVGA